MTEYIIITKPAEKESENTINLLDGTVLQAGLKKDIESIESYLRHMNWAEHFEKCSERKLKNHYYFVNGAIRIRRYPEDQNLEFFPLKPYTNTQGSVFYRAKAADILFQFDKKIKEEFPEAKYKLKIKHLACCIMQPRIAFDRGNLKQIKEAFPEFLIDDRADKTEYNSQIMPPGLEYEEDYEEHRWDYYDCERCDPLPCWAPMPKERPSEDPHEGFYDQKVPKKGKGSPRKKCLGTKSKINFVDVDE